MTTKGTIPEEKEKPVIVLTEGKYGLILMDSRNWAVAKRKAVIGHIDGDTSAFDGNSYTYSPQYPTGHRKFIGQVDERHFKKGM